MSSNGVQPHRSDVQKIERNPNVGIQTIQIDIELVKIQIDIKLVNIQIDIKLVNIQIDIELARVM